jgi:hypothetical protein
LFASQTKHLTQSPTLGMETPEDEVSLLAEEGRPSKRSSSRQYGWMKLQVAYVAFLHLAVILLFTIVVIQDNRVWHMKKSNTSLYCKSAEAGGNNPTSTLTVRVAPANVIIKYENVVFFDNIFDISPYQGAPDDAKDEMWRGLYRSMILLCF